MNRQVKDKIALSLVWFSAALTLAFLAWMLTHILGNGLKYVNWNFITADYSVIEKATAGIWPMLVSSFYMVLLSIGIAAPIAIMTALYLTEYAKSTSKVVKLIRFCTESLAGIPSIIYGLFGMSFFVITLGLGFSLLSGALTLAMLVLPVIIRTTEEALMAVPQSYRDGAYGLGVSKIYTIYRVILPAAMPGIITAIILSTGRVIGESAPVFLTAGMVAKVPESVLESGRTLTVHLYKLTQELYTQHDWNQAYATATVLIVVVLLLNMLTKFIGRYVSKAR